MKAEGEEETSGTKKPAAAATAPVSVHTSEVVSNEYETTDTNIGSW